MSNEHEEYAVVQSGPFVPEDEQGPADPGLGETSVEESSVEGASVEGTSLEGASLEETSLEETSLEGTSLEETSAAEPSVAGPAWPAAAPTDTVAPGEEHVPAVEELVHVDEHASDPFAAWPQAESAEVIEDLPEEEAAIGHVAGEIDVPAGYTVLEGTPTGHRRTVALVVSRFNGGLTNRMLACAIEALEEAGVLADAVTVVPVPGAFELPLAAMALAKTRRYACVVALGAIVRGETSHFDYIASEAASGLQLAAIETGVPVAFGVLTVETVEQAEARIDRAAEAVRTALEMADVFAQLRASAQQ